jgi:dephospho-CoA kinase
MRRPFRLGLTGSIGMGKSTTAQMFADEGVPVWDADAAVHRLYAPGGAAVDAMRTICPEAVSSKGVDRAILRRWIAEDPSALSKIEGLVHPLVAQDREAFLARTASDIVVLDIPLLFETGGETNVDAVVVVTAPGEIQRKRVLSRPDMTEDHFEAILAKQLPDAEKRSRADYVIETVTMEAAGAAVRETLADIRRRLNDA